MQTKTIALKSKFSLGLTTALLLSLLIPGLARQARGASLQNTYVRLDRMSASTNTPFRVAFKVPATGGGGTEDKLKVSFDDNFTLLTSGYTTNVANCATETGFTSLPGTFTITSSNTNGSKHVTVS